MRPLKILFTIGSLKIGGAESQLALLVERLFFLGHEPVVFCLQGGGFFEERLEKIGVRVITCGLRKGDLRKAPWKILQAQMCLHKTIKSIKPQIIHAFLPFVTFMASVAGRILDVDKIITSRRALGNHQDRYPFLFLFDVVSNMLSHYITVNSLGVKNDLISREIIGKEKIVLIYNGINSEYFTIKKTNHVILRRELGILKSTKIVITVASLIPYKGHEDLLHAAAIVISQWPEVTFLIVGEDRGIQNRLETISKKLDIKDNIKFLGQQDIVDKLLAISDIFVLPSHEEGFSNAILESMAAGLPVVATSVGGNPEAVVNGHTGWLVPIKNPEALAEKIFDLIRHSDKARELGQNGLKRAMELFSVDRMVDAHLRLYNRSKKVGPHYLFE